MTAHDDPTADTTSLALAPPPAKRARLLLPVEPDALPAIFTPTICTSSPPPRQLSVSSSYATDERVLSALSQGVLAFLSLADATALVQTSRLLRSDAPHSIARLLPDFKRLFPDESSVVFRLPNDWPTRLSNASAVVATAHFLQQRVAKWSFTYAPHRPNADDDLLCSVQPVVVPLALFRDDPMATTTTWSRSAIQQALNTFCAGGGDAFFDGKRAANGSRFATHWDSIHVDRVTGRVSCRLCATTQNALAQYKQQVETGLRQYELLLRCQEATWSRKTAEEREQLTKAFHAKCFKADAYLRPECAAWPDARLLRHIYEHGKLQAWSIGDTRARGIASVDAFLRAVSFAYQHQCRTFYQPLKQTLHARNHVVGRIPHATLPPAAQTSERVLTELVGGVDAATGIFSGVQVTFRLTP